MSGTSQAFLSYTRLDDQAHDGGITALRAALELQVRIVTGDDSFEIFQDVDGIAFGEHWPKKLDQALAAARFLIPVLSPRFFRSEPCREELRKFLAHERAAGRDDLILPVYLVRAPMLEQAHLTAADELAAELAQRQRWDWRPHAFASRSDPAARRAVRELAEAIGERLERDVRPTTQAETDRLRLAPSIAEAIDREQPAPPTVIESTQASATAQESSATVDLPAAEPELAARGAVTPEDAPSKAARSPPHPTMRETGARPVSQSEVESGSPRAGTAPEQPPQPRRNAARLAALACVAVAVVGTGVYAVINSQPERRAGERFTDTLKDGSPCPFCPEMVVIPAGSFTMGLSDAERKWSIEQNGSEDPISAEPQHLVTFAADFALGRTEVTRAQFAQFVDETGRAPGSTCFSRTGRQDTSWREPGFRGFEQKDTHPVLCVSWIDAMDYAAWLKQRTGEDYRLPSESEWEYAARAGSTTVRFWGDDWKSRDACVFANAADLTANFLGYRPLNCRDGSTYTAPVASYKPNDFGLADILGNVSEWTQDCYHNGYADAPNNGSAWATGDCSKRVYRGGSWFATSTDLRSSSRGSFRADTRTDALGFRVARMLAH